MSGAGAGADVRVCIVSGRQGFGRPERSLVTMGGGPGVSVASATNSNAMSADHCQKGKGWHCYVSTARASVPR
jgi:hypothetical protein